jgi:hypothetical protein
VPLSIVFTDDNAGEENEDGVANELDEVNH